ncbi:MAG: hypothetical protein Q4A05_05715 [Ruminococcus sp.]|nr:hypothetical protein [Ruminococcus sp.]
MMKTSRLPDKKEWERIVDEAFSPGEEHSFSQGYISRKNAMMRGITMKRHTVDNRNKNSTRAFVLSVAAVAAAFAIVPAGFFFAGKGGGVSDPAAEVDELAETTALEEELTTEFTETAAETEFEETISLEDVENYGFKKLELNYVPEGLVYSEDGAYGGKYHDYETGGGMSNLLFVTDEYQQLIYDSFNYDSAEYDLDGKHVIIRYAETNENREPVNSFSRWIFVKFNDSPYVATLHITDNYSDEEALKVCEGMELVDCDAADFHVNIWTDNFTESPAQLSLDSRKEDNSLSYKLDLDDVYLYGVGDTFASEYHKETARQSGDEHAFCYITLNSARVQDSFDGITTDGCGWDKDYSIYVGEDGRLNDPNYDLRIVVLDLTYTNNSDVETDFCICPKMCSYKDGCITPIDLFPTNHHVNGEANGFNCESGLHFSFDSDKKGEKNHIVLEAGESAEVQLAFVIEADDLGTLIYGAEPSYNGNFHDYYDSPLVDLRDLT